MEKKSKNTIIVSIIALAIVLVGVTYAYFSARITGLESASMLSLTAGRMGIVYSEGNENVTFSNIYPKEEAWATKTFALTGYNTTNLDMEYNLGLNIITNTFTNGYLTYDLTLVSGSNGTPVASKTNQPLNGTGKISFGMGSFIAANGDSHNYELKIYFKDNGLDQNDSQNAVFNGKIYVEEWIEPAPDGWRDAPAGSLLAGIKTNNRTPTTPLTVPGQEVATAQEAVLASTEDDYGISYYYRGAVDNNYVSFAGMCWRIVRIDGLGNIKITLYNYNPTSAANPCAANLDGNKMAFARYDNSNWGSRGLSKFNSYSGNAYIGYMYSNNPTSNDYLTAHANDNDSTILTNLKIWYDLKFSVTQKNQLADVIWCNDKRVVSNTTYNPWTISDLLGTGLNNDKTYYQVFQRLYPYDSINSTYNINNAVPSLKCGNNINDNKISKFTASDTIYGNGTLNEHKIGLLTADEVAFAGAAFESGNSTYYLYKNANDGSANYWTMTPNSYVGGALTYITSIGGNGAISYTTFNIFNGVRPTIALKSDVTISGGNGSNGTPFVVQ